MPGLEESLYDEPNELLFNEEPVDENLLKKASDIENVLASSISDEEKLKKLRSFARSDGGLVNDSLRKRVWPKLLGVDTSIIGSSRDNSLLEVHPEYEQVVLDVRRSLKRFPPSIPYEERVLLQDKLTELIMRVMIEYRDLNYYQGYHDVAVTILLVVGEDTAFQIMKYLSNNNLRNAMLPTMKKISYLLNFVYPLIERCNPGLADYLETSELGTMFCLSWYLTWFSHDLKHYRDVVRLYDFFLVSPPLMPLYLAAAIVVHRQEEIFSVECDLAAIHSLLNEVPDDLPFEKLLVEADKLYEKYPPESIEEDAKERYQRELDMLKPSAKKRVPAERKRHISLWIMLLGIRRIAARQPFKMLFATVSIAVALWAYMRPHHLYFLR